MAAPNDNFFKNYWNPVFIETGSCVGEGIQKAINAGFEKIYSIELSEELHNACVKRFEDHPHVKLFHGDSRNVLKEIVDGLNEPATFWLDAHYSGGTTAGEGDPIILFDELEIIECSPIKIHTIMIDDLRDWGKENIELFTMTMLEINPDYEISLVDGWLHKDDILVARIPR